MSGRTVGSVKVIEEVKMVNVGRTDKSIFI